MSPLPLNKLFSSFGNESSSKIPQTRNHQLCFLPVPFLILAISLVLLLFDFVVPLFAPFLSGEGLGFAQA